MIDLTAWQNRFPRDTKPTYGELLAFLPQAVQPLFLRFNEEMNAAYGVYNKWQRYERDAGWVYGYCRNYRCELLRVTIEEQGFSVLGVCVTDEASLAQALQRVREAYDAGYEERYARLAAEKRADQMRRARARTAAERGELAQLQAEAGPGRFNRFRWSPKVPRRKLVRLYEGEAQGRLDEALLDDVGYSFYSRCHQAAETRAHLDRGELLCHTCGAVLHPGGYAEPVACACGDRYTYREYRRSLNAANMPGGRAAPIFQAFQDRWPGCKDAREKMLLIDWLIHECHVSVMSGDRGRSVCVNLIEGTHAQLRALLERLAGHEAEERG